MYAFIFTEVKVIGQKQRSPEHQDKVKVAANKGYNIKKGFSDLSPFFLVAGVGT